MIDLKMIDHLAALSKLSFTEEEKMKFIGDFNDILKNIEKMNDINIDDIVLEEKVLDAMTELRKDDSQEIHNEKFTAEELRKMSENFERGAFVVPLIIE